MTQSTLQFYRSLTTICFLAVCTPAYSQETPAKLDMAAVELAWKNGDFGQARKGLKLLAETLQTPLTQYRYGRILLEGRGGPQDAVQGMQWLEKAVAQNHVEASTLLARAILSQPKASRDEARAAALFANAAARGNAEAQYYLGLLYRTGVGVTADPVAAFNWLLASSEGFNAAAQFELSRAYFDGLGTPVNKVEALRWLEEAASAGQADAQYTLATYYEVGEDVSQSPSQSLKWYTKAAEKGHILAQRTLGTKYLQGFTGQTPDADLALRWLGTAAKAGDPGAMNNLAIGYLQGDVLPQNDALAVQYYTEASEQKLGRATLALAKMTEAGRGTPASLQDALALYMLAARQGEAEGLDRVSKLALSGRLDTLYAPHDLVQWVTPSLETQDNESAVAWMETQAKSGVRNAQAALGKWSLTQKDRAQKGIELIRSAAIAGHVPSQVILGTAYSTGDNVDLDYVKAYAWFNVAATSGQDVAIETRSLITNLMTPEQIAQAQILSKSYFQEAARHVPTTDQSVTKVTE